MRIVISSAALLCGLAFASPLAAADPPTSATAQNDKSDKVICRREQTVGTLFEKSLCLTRSQWKKRDQMAHEGKDHILDQLNRRAIENPNPPGEGGR
jgi:hypothetical protein